MHNPVLRKYKLTREEYQQTVRDSLAPHRLELLKQQHEWIEATESWISQCFIAGSEVDIAHIRPKLELVTTERQRAIWRYCRLWGSIPYSYGCGRRLHYLLRDDGQPKSPVMGIIAISSPVLISKPRDQWIGWEYPRDADLKRRRLLTCMDLTVSMAVQPYNYLTAGKLICLAAFSNEVRRMYWDRYHDMETPTHIREGRLALIITTSLYGSSVQYNRLRVGSRLAYQPVGYTSGFGNSHITEKEFRKMEKYLTKIGKTIPKGWGTGRSYRLRVYSAYCRNRFGPDAQIAHEQARSVYLAPLAENTRGFLRGEEEELKYYDMPFSYLTEIWRNRWLAARLESSEVMQHFRSSDPSKNFLSLECKSSGCKIEQDRAFE